MIVVCCSLCVAGCSLFGVCCSLFDVLVIVCLMLGVWCLVLRVCCLSCVVVCYLLLLDGCLLFFRLMFDAWCSFVVGCLLVVAMISSCSFLLVVVGVVDNLLYAVGC